MKENGNRLLDNREQIVHELTMEIMKKEIERVYQERQNMAPMSNSKIAEQVLEKYLLVARVMNNRLNEMKQTNTKETPSPFEENYSEHPKLIPEEDMSFNNGIHR